MGAWGGGGLFDDENHVQLNHSVTEIAFPVQADQNFDEHDFGPFKRFGR